MEILDQLIDLGVTVSRLAQIVEEMAWFSKELGQLQFQTFMSVEIVSKFLIRQCNRRIYSLDLILQLEMLLFHEAELKESVWIAHLQSFIGFDHIL